MPRNVTKDSCAKDVEAAAGRTTAKGSGGDAFRQVNFNAGEKEIYATKGKPKK